jgi:putative DNA primase/helicase
MPLVDDHEGRRVQEYEISEDTLASFVRDECLIGPHWHCKVADLRARYEAHCTEMGAEPLTAKALTMRLTSEYPVVSGQGTKGVRIYRGIDLQAVADE